MNTFPASQPLFQEDNRQGCTPPLCLSTSSESASWNYLFYILLEGPHAGIYVDWGVVDGYKEPRMVASGCRDEADALSKWRNHCLQSHEHRPGDDSSFVNPFTALRSEPGHYNHTTGSTARPVWVNQADIVTAADRRSRSTLPTKDPSAKVSKNKAWKLSPVITQTSGPSKSQQRQSVHYLLEGRDGRSVYSDSLRTQNAYLDALSNGEAVLKTSSDMDEVMHWLEHGRMTSAGETPETAGEAGGKRRQKELFQDETMEIIASWFEVGRNIGYFLRMKGIFCLPGSKKPAKANLVWEQKLDGNVDSGWAGGSKFNQPVVVMDKELYPLSVTSVFLSVVNQIGLPHSWLNAHI
ncbi:hypothetical protein C8J56DRAFT_888986 [Mycena floridula]|nr:hypothetical protein C8J56DRAFT_888986 [Mycena floridula]